jgi:hypothetical protein
MLKQRINLLPPRITPKTDWLSFDCMVRASAVVIGIAVLWAGWSYWIEMKTKKELKQVSADAQLLEQQVTEAEQAFGLLKPDATLLKRQERLEKRLKTKHQLLTLLARISPEQHPGFSYPMHDVAEVMPKGMWLTDLQFNNRESGVSFSGVTLDASLMPVFFSELSLTPSFLGFSINSLQTTAIEATNHHQFDALGTRPPTHIESSGLDVTVNESGRKGGVQ